MAMSSPAKYEPAAVLAVITRITCLPVQNGTRRTTHLIRDDEDLIRSGRNAVGLTCAPGSAAKTFYEGWIHEHFLRIRSPHVSSHGCSGRRSWIDRLHAVPRAECRRETARLLYRCRRRAVHAVCDAGGGVAADRYGLAGA